MSKVERAHSYQKTQSQEQAGIAVVVKREQIKVKDYTQGGIMVFAIIETRRLGDDTRQFLRYHN